MGKKFLHSILAALLFFASHHSFADFWTQKANYPGNGRSRSFCFSIDDKGYIGCGEYIGYASDFYQYDTTLNSWTQKASFGGGGRWSGGSFAVGGYGFAGLGWSAGLTSDMWKYDPVNDTWTQVNNFPAGQRQLPASFVIGTKAYFAAGRNNMNVLQNDLWEYDYTIDAWTQKSNVPGPVRSQPFGFSINGLGYVGGGFDQALNGLNDFYEYNPVNDTWTARASLPAAGRGDPAGFAIGCMGYTGTGQTLPVNNVLNDFWEYNPATNQWIPKTQFAGTARDEAAFFVIGGKGYLGLGGINGGSLNGDFWEYTPDTTCLVAPPVAVFTAPNIICPGTCTGFINQSTGATSFQWYFPGASPDTSSAISPDTICYSAPGNYDVTLIASNAAGSDTLMLSNYITVYPYPSPQGIHQSGDTLLANPGAVNYQWYYSGAIIPGATDYFYVATNDGDYNVVATDLNGCEVEAVIYDVMTATSSMLFSDQIKIYPNPVADKLIVQPVHQTPVSISIYSLLGEKIISPVIIDTESAIDVSRLRPAVYCIEVSVNGITFRKPFIKSTLEK